MKSSKVIYFLLTGAIIAALALFVVFYETETVDDKEVVVPLVNKVVDAKPIIVKPGTDIALSGKKTAVYSQDAVQYEIEDTLLDFKNR